MKNNLLVYILLCLLNLSWANARNKQQEAEALIKKSVEALYNNPKQASYYAAKVIELFPEERQNDQKAEAMFYYSQAEKLLGNFDVSIKNLYDALEYATPANKELNGQIYALIGALYCKLTDYNKAIEMNEKAISIFKSIGDSISIALCYNDRGIIHYSLNSAVFFLVRKFYMLRCLFGALYVDMRCFGVSWFFSKHKIPHPNQWGSMKNHKK